MCERCTQKHTHTHTHTKWTSRVVQSSAFMSSRTRIVDVGSRSVEVGSRSIGGAGAYAACNVCIGVGSCCTELNLIE